MTQQRKAFIIIAILLVSTINVGAKLAPPPHISTKKKQDSDGNSFSSLIQTKMKSGGVSGATQVGTYTQTYLPAGSVPFSSGSDDERYETATITFPTPFNKAPSVAVAISSFDLTNSYAGVRVYANDITRTGFTLTIVAPPQCQIYNIGVSWLATISAWSGIYVSNVCMYNYCNEDINDFISVNSGAKSFYTTIDHPATLANPKVVAAFSGFHLRDSSKIPNIVVNVDTLTDTDVKLELKTMGGAYFYGAGITVLHFNDDGYQGSEQIFSGSNLATGSGDRYDYHTLTADVSGSLVWPSFYALNPNNNYFYRLTISATVSGTTITATFYTWYYSQITLAGANIFYTNS